MKPKLPKSKKRKKCWNSKTSLEELRNLKLWREEIECKLLNSEKDFLAPLKNKKKVNKKRVALWQNASWKFQRSKREFQIVIKERRLFYFYIILFPFKWQLITFIAELGLTSYNSNFEILYKMRCVLPTSLKLTSVDSLIWRI